jgi:hypothetical protein
MTPNTPQGKDHGWLSPVVHLCNNWISLAGVALVTTTTVFWLFLLPTTLRGQTENPYVGILAFLTVPAPFFLGLVLIPVGILIKRRREGRTGIHPLDQGLRWSNPEVRRLVYFVGIATVVNIAIASQLTYSAVGYMDSVTFCGRTCHNVMQPEYTAYQESPHSRVECVKCHIGPGAGWFVRSKLSGVGQVFAVALNTYPRPIPTPVTNLRPARETCEACHWPQKYGEDRVRIVSKFSDDENNTATKTVLLMKIGGGNNGIGIHGTHLGPGVLISYGASDQSRQTIPWVKYTTPDGKSVVYATPGTKPDGAGLDKREMDCVDCHNRPSHAYDLPERAVDRAMNAGLIAPSLPFAKKKAVEILKVNYASRDQAASQIPQAFAEYYRQAYPAVWAARQADVVASGKEIVAIYDRNIFPDMNVTWGKYPNNIGHTDFPGCWRCHDSNHTAQSGAVITQDCAACHNMLAVDEANPKVLTKLGITEAKPPEAR